ncbi:hypothetical protein FICEBENF_02042 [Aeromonas hydrophila]
MRRTIQGWAALVRAYSSEVQPVRSKKQRGRSSHADLETGDPGAASFIPPGTREESGSSAGMVGCRVPCDNPRPHAGNRLYLMCQGCTSLLSAQVCMGKPVTCSDSWGRSRPAAASRRCARAAHPCYLQRSAWASLLHVGIVGAGTTLRRCPDDILARIFDVAGLAVDAVGRVDLQAGQAL